MYYSDWSDIFLITYYIEPVINQQGEAKANFACLGV